jgi:hypothetical protein
LKCTEAIKNKSSKISEIIEIRPLLIFLEFPLLTEYLYNEILLNIFKAILSLPSKFKEIFKTWIYFLPKSFTQKYVGIIQQYITVQLYHSGMIDENIGK